MRLLGAAALGAPWITAVLVTLGWAVWVAAAVATGILLGLVATRSD